MGPARRSKLVEYQDRPSASREGRPGGRLASAPFVRAGGFWRNFKAKYAETDEMYSPDARRLEPPGRSCPGLDRGRSRTSSTSPASELYRRASATAPYWHGAFGGLYLPHLRNAVYRNLINAHNALDEAEGLAGPRVSIEVGDFNLDARQEVRLENDRLVALRPARRRGGTSTSWTSATRRRTSWPRSTAGPRPTTGPSPPRAASGSDDYDGPPSILDKVVLKQEGLGRPARLRPAPA